MLLSVMLPLYIASHITFETQVHLNSVVNSELWEKRIDVFVKCDSIDYADDFDPLELPKGFQMLNISGQHSMIYDSYWFELNEEFETDPTVTKKDGSNRNLGGAPSYQRESLAHMISLKGENIPLSEDFFDEDETYCIEELI